MQRGVAHVPDGRGTFVELTVEENLRLGAYIRRDRQGVAQDFERVFGYFPRLRERFASRPARCPAASSRCWRSRARCCCGRRLLLLDEPSFGLAPLIVQEIFAIMHRIRADEGVSILLVEQNASLALEIAEQAYLLETGRIVISGPAAEIRRDEFDPALVSGILKAGTLSQEIMEGVLHQVLSGIASGGIYASVALALVMIYQATHHVNFAQGEMATFSTYIALTLINVGLPYWVAFVITVVVSFVIGLLIERILMRPMRMRRCWPRSACSSACC